MEYFVELTGDVTQADIVVESQGKKTTIKSSQTSTRGKLSVSLAPYSANIFRIIFTHQPHDEPAYQETFTEKTVNLNESIWGTLLFDETIDGSVFKPQRIISAGGGLVVPANISLTFNNARLTACNISGQKVFWFTCITMLGTVKFKNCIFEEYMYIAQTSPIFDECFFREGCDIMGGAPRFTGCEFYSTVRLLGRTSASFEKNVFSTGINFSEKRTDIPEIFSWTEQGPSPSITGNAFIGQSALYYVQDPLTPMPPPPSPIPIGADNYYGDPDPVLSINNKRSGGMFATRAADISINRKEDPPGEPPKPFFEVLGANKTWAGSFRNDKGMPPRFWKEGYVIGQNSISHSALTHGLLLADRQTLVSVDVGVSEDVLYGVKFYALFDGEELPPTNPEITLYRDISRHGKSSIQEGKSTVNFILQKNKTTAGEHTLEVWLDPTGITGFDKIPEKQCLINTKLVFGSKYKRTLNIHVLPIQLWLPFLNG
ncbi:MAG TPA: hypothetical protein P5128_10530 [Candidatus Sumerlaeia bacterium]|nr:hypothetical protein [Candidatus Sumerlaeia bacterium]